jgi:hypothetical protein
MRNIRQKFVAEIINSGLGFQVQFQPQFLLHWAGSSAWFFSLLKGLARTGFTNVSSALTSFSISKQQFFNSR